MADTPTPQSIQLRPYQANETARGLRFDSSWHTDDITQARALLSQLPLTVNAARNHPAELLERLEHEWYIWRRNDRLEPTKGAVKQCYEAWKAGKRRVLLAAVTGDGKTEIAVKIASDCAKAGWTCIFVADQQNLVKQSVKRFEKYGLRVGVIWAGAKKAGLNIDPTAPIQVCSLQTLQSLERSATAKGETPAWRRHRGAPKTLWIFDEAHDQTAWSELGRSILDNPGESWYLLLTGSPFRLSPKQGMLDICDALAWTRCYYHAVRLPVPDVNAAYARHGYHGTSLGSILPVRYVGVKIRGAKVSTEGVDRGADGDFNTAQLTKLGCDPKLLEAQYQEWSTHNFRRTLAFCASIEHATKAAAAWAAKGIQTGVVTGAEPTTGIFVGGELKPIDREDVCKHLASGRIRIVFSIGAMIKGVDIAEIDSGLCLRPTESFALFVQMTGRIRRPCDHLGLMSATWLDMTDNAVTFAHQLESMQEFTITKGSKEAKRQPREITGKECPRCKLIVARDALSCVCGYTWVRPAVQQLQSAILSRYEINTTGKDAPQGSTDRARAQFRRDLHAAYHGADFGQFRGGKKHPGLVRAVHHGKYQKPAPDDWHLNAIFGPKPQQSDREMYRHFLGAKALARKQPDRAKQPDSDFVHRYYTLEFGA